MSEVTPPPPPPPTPPAAPPPPSPTAVVPNPPPALSQLPVGARIEAVIQAIAPQAAVEGAIEVDTAIGRLLIQTGFPLPKDGPLQLQITAKGAQVQLLITQIHGQAPLAALRALGIPLTAATPGAALAGAGQAPGQPGHAASAAGGLLQGGPAAGQGAQGAIGAAAGTPGVQGQPLAVNLTVGAVVGATLLRAGPAVPATPQGAGQATPGATAQATGQAATGPSSATPATPGATSVPGAQAQPGQGGTAAPQPGQTARPGPAAATAQPGAPATPQAPGAQPAPPGQPLPGTLFGLRITAFQPAPGGAAPLPPPPAGGALAVGSVLTGVVTGQAQPSGHAVVQTHAGTLAIATPTALPAGSTVTFEVLSLQAPAPGETQHISPGRADADLFGRWPALEEALRTIAETNPQLAQQVIQAAIPTPGTALAANVLFFLVALTGDLRGWLGDAPYRLLQRVNPGLLGKLKDDFNRIQKLSNEPRTGDWRVVPVPFMAGDTLEQLRLFMRPAGEDAEDDDEGRKGTRFIVELDLSVIGRFQLDGLVYEKDKHMDLIVRTENALPGRIENDIRDIFENAGEVTGLKGGITFQAAPPNFVEVTVPAEPENPLGLLV